MCGDLVVYNNNGVIKNYRKFMKTTYTHQLKAQAIERIMEYMADHKESDHGKTQRFCKVFIRQDLALLKQLR